MMPKIRTLLLSALLIMTGTSIALCASVTVVPSGAGSYSVQGNSLNGVAGIELNLGYDKTSLATPTVTQGSLVSGALMAANTTIPGSIKIAIISTSPFSGTGEIVRISFATQSGSGGITSVTSSMIDSNGAGIAAPASLSENSPSTDSVLSTKAGVPFQTPTQQSASTTPTQTTTTTGTIPTILGTVTMSSDVPVKNDTKPSETKPTETKAAPQTSPNEPSATASPAEPASAEKPASEPQKPEKVKVTSYKGVLENFRTYNGVKTTAMLIALFNNEIAPNIRQEPAIALSDGKTSIRVVIKREGADDRSPNFALNGAKLVSLNRDLVSDTWIIEALPQIGIIQAGLTILTDSDIIEYPLTLSPSFERTSSSEADFAAFLKDSGAANPRRDLNGDGRHDYLDDYIYTANYILKKSAAGKTKK